MTALLMNDSATYLHIAASTTCRYLAVKAELPQALRMGVTGLAARDAVSGLAPASLQKSVYRASHASGVRTRSSTPPGSPPGLQGMPAASNGSPGRPGWDESFSPAAPSSEASRAGSPGREAIPHRDIEESIMRVVTQVCQGRSASTP